jgi:lipopolysaccharide transport system permease protein
VPLFETSWIYFPVILLIQVALGLGLGFVGAALNVFYRDIKHLIMLGLQIWLYASPVIYPVSVVPVRFRSLYFLNPMAGVIEAYRAVLLHGKAPDLYLLGSAFAALAILLAGYGFFKRVEFQFADVV